jgi:hypothetical protein
VLKETLASGWTQTEYAKAIDMFPSECKLTECTGERYATARTDYGPNVIVPYVVRRCKEADTQFKIPY